MLGQGHTTTPAWHAAARDAVIASAAILIVMTAAAGYVYQNAAGMMAGEIRANLCRLAAAAASRVDGGAHESLSSPSQQSSPTYASIRHELQDFQRAVGDAKYVYTARVQGGRVIFVVDAAEPVDSDGDGVIDQAMLGEVYEHPDGALRACLQTGRPVASERPYRDKWGSFMSGFAPVLDTAGRAVAVTGVDITADEFVGRTAGMRRALLIGIVPALALCILVGSAVYRARIDDAAGRARADRETELARDRHTLLATIATAPQVAAADLEAVARMITERAAPLMGVERVSVWVFSADGSELRSIDEYVAKPGSHTSGTTLGEAEFGPEFAALRTRRFVNADDAFTDERTRAYVDAYLRPLGIRAMLDASIRDGAGCLGVICFEHVGSLRRWLDHEIAFACQLADQIALVIAAAERRQTAGAVAASERRYRTLLDSGNDAVFVHGMCEDGSPGRFTDVNARACEMLGYRRDELLEMGPLDLSVLSPTQNDDISVRLLGQGSAVFSAPHRRKDGTTMYAELSSRVQMLDGAPVVLTIMRDITERRRAERFAGQTRELAMALSEAPCLTDALRACTDAAIAVSEMDCGGIYLVDEATGSLSLAWHRGLPPAFIESGSSYGPNTQQARIVHQGAPIYSDYGSLSARIETVNPREGLRAIAIVPVSHRGRVIACLNVASHAAPEVPANVRTALETVASQVGPAVAEARVREALREREENLRAFFDGSPDLLFVLGESGRILQANAAALVRLGHTMSNLTDRPVTDVHARGRDSEVTATVTSMLSGLQDTCVVPLVAADGSEIPVETRISRGTWNGAPALFGICRDVTERQRADTEIRRLNDELRSLASGLEERVQSRTSELVDAYKELESVSYAVSHDLRGPLRNIDGFAAIIEEDGGDALTPQTLRHLAVIRQTAAHLGRVIDGMLDFVQIGRVTVRRTETDVSTVARSAWNRLLGQQPEFAAELRLGDVGKVNADAALLGIVFDHLLSNAAKFSSARTQPVVEIGSELCDGLPAFYVRDNGVGFDMRFAGKLFGVFERLHHPDEFAGIGIGLAIVHRIIGLHHGRVWAESEVGRGATFWFTVGE